MNDTLKVAGRIGAELGAAKAENEMLRELLRDVEFRGALTGWEPGLIGQITAALAQQAEPTDTYTAVDMATAAAQGFRDGQAAVEQAPAQDETEPVYQFQWREIGEGDWMACSHSWFRFCEASPEHDTRVVEVARPAQTEQQPVAFRLLRKAHAGDWVTDGRTWIDGEPSNVLLKDIAERSDTWRLEYAYAAPIAQTAPQGKFRMGDLMKKSTGSEWEGRVVGWYSTEQTKEGYAVESSAHRNSVQIYPVTALEAVE